uniref:Uncharacterized protein n=1 Tax=Meloidogyne enterolobii TaxID=390850 RepID=A0A6V7WBX5_MELEN|nr:unnamed protein product [Meloidogyne enterolobii]
MKSFSIIFIFVFAFFVGSEAIRMIRNYGQPSFSGGNMGGGGCCGGEVQWGWEVVDMDRVWEVVAWE